MRWPAVEACFPYHEKHFMAFTTIVVLSYAGIVLVMSLLCFVAYGFDKQRAINGGRRVPENTLQFLAFLGGWPGAILAQRHFRHKTQKASFLLVFWCLVVLHFVIAGGVVFAAIALTHSITT